MTTQNVFYALQEVLRRPEGEELYALSAEKFARGYSLKSMHSPALSYEALKDSASRMRQWKAPRVQEFLLKVNDSKRYVYLLGEARNLPYVATMLEQWLENTQGRTAAPTNIRERFFYGYHDTLVAWWALNCDVLITFEKNVAEDLLQKINTNDINSSSARSALDSFAVSSQVKSQAAADNIIPRDRCGHRFSISFLSKILK